MWGELTASRHAVQALVWSGSGHGQTHVTVPAQLNRTTQTSR